MDKKTPPKTDTLSSQVLEYFRKYSGDQNLSSYLRGVLPQHQQQPQQESEVRSTKEVNKVNKPVVDEFIGDNLIVESEDNTKIDQTIEREGNISPTSSLTSNRKLEWDNGADIGYEYSNNRVSLHKSFSLPILTSLEKTEKPLKSINVENPSKIYYSSTESSDKSVKPSIVSSSSSYYKSEEHKFDTTTSSSFAFKPWSSEQERVGSPVAQSTPNIERPVCKRTYSSDTPSPSTVVSNDTNSDNKMVVTELKCVAKFKRSKIIKLSLTKPISVDCLNYKQYNDKDIQTNGDVIKSESIGIQTEGEPYQINENNDFSQKLEHIKELIDKPEKQIIEYVKYSSNSSERHSSKSIGTNTISDLVSNCNSFEFLCPDDINQRQPDEDLEENERLNAAGASETDKKSSNSNSNGISDKNLSTPLGDMISCNLSGGRNVDIEKSLLLLKRLIKSKRYDKITKEYFIKKIIEKMVKLNSSSSDSSSLNDQKDNRNDTNKLHFNQNDDNSLSSKEVSEKLLEPSLKKRLQENVPWVPGTFNKSIQNPKKLEIKIFSSDIFPDNNNNDDQSKRKVKDSRFTLTSSILNQPQTNSSTSTKTSDKEQINDNKNIENNLKNWKDHENITQSEKRFLFEPNSKGDGDKTDSLVKFAKKERENQLNWINDEISHLNKLKMLLQKNYFENGFKKDEENKKLEEMNTKNDKFNLNDDKSNLKNGKPNLEIEVLTKPHVEDMKKMTNSAAVYVITTDKSRYRGHDNHQQRRPSRVNGEVKEAKLVSSEVYKSDKPFTCIRRYIFEIPVECECKCDNYPCSHVVDAERSVGTSGIGSKKSTKRICHCYDYFTEDDLDPPEGFQDKSTPKPKVPHEFDDVYDKASMTEREFDHVSKHTNTTRDENQQTVHREEKDSIDKASMTEQDDSYDRGVQVRMPSIQIHSEQSKRGNEQSDTICENFKENSDLSYGTDTELKSTKKRMQYPHSSSTSEHQKRHFQDCYPDTLIDHKRYAEFPQTGNNNYPKKQPKRHEKSSSSSSSTTTSSSQTILIKICPCCNQKRTPAVNKSAINKYKSALHQLPCQINESLCQPCHMNTKLTIDPHTGQYKMIPGHVCNCYTLMRTQTVNQIKETVKQLEELENEATSCPRCSCTKKTCFCSTMSSGRSKKGIAYTLTLEDGEYEELDSDDCRKRKKSLDEIKLKIPNRKKKSKHSKKRHKKRDKSSDRSRMTLQDYLCVNRPNFIQNAEERRRTLIELAYLREKRCQKYKQLLAKTKGLITDNEENKKIKNGLFSGEEMRKITAKNYKKLPEVQNKLKEQREINTKKANRLLADMFNKKIQQNALKGKVDLSTTASVIKFI